MIGTAFQEELAGFILYMEGEKLASPHTVNAYRADIEQFAAFVYERQGPGAGPADVDTWLVRRFLGRLNQLGQEKTSINRKLAALRSFYRYLLREGK
ncbi:MAG: site-specific integrase, partial [Moorella sp. (in: Bacteria)]|nr:site-specific integrase [Moorella sp. (in: firmicutes)]